MKKALTIGLLLLLLPGVAQAAVRVYLAGHGGITTTENATWTDGNLSGDFSYDRGGTFLLSLGLKLGVVRPELELGVRKVDISGFRIDGTGTQALRGDQSIATAMGNLILDLPLAPGVTPFLLAGAGMAGVEGNYSNEWGHRVEDDTVFAWQAGAGVGLALTQRVHLDLQYRYLQTGEANLRRPLDILATLNGAPVNGPNLEVQTQDVLLGIRILF